MKALEDIGGADLALDHRNLRPTQAKNKAAAVGTRKSARHRWKVSATNRAKRMKVTLASRVD